MFAAGPAGVGTGGAEMEANGSAELKKAQDHTLRCVAYSEIFCPVLWLVTATVRCCAALSPLLSCTCGMRKPEQG